MSTGAPLPGRLKTTEPGNGYESPQELLPHASTSSGIDQLAHEHIRRHGFTNTEKAGERNHFFAGQEETQRQPMENSNEPQVRTIGVRDRIGCFTWTWFTMTMATGGIAHCLHAIPFRAEWLTIIGTIFFFVNMILFIFNCVMITLRFRFKPGSFRGSFTNQSESLFFPACVRLHLLP